MSKYINADEFRALMYHKAFEEESELQKWDSGCWIRYKLFEQALDEMPSADVRENIHGEWATICDGLDMVDYHICSLCGHNTYEHYPNFCPNCGANMRGKTE